jgi:hypothetical protein
MNFEIGKKYLVNVDGWFHAPDGKQYRAVFGTLKGIYSDTETLGVRTNARSANWYVQIGDTTVAGCRIHYVVQCDVCNLGEAEQWATVEGKNVRDMAPSAIYGADRE